MELLKAELDKLIVGKEFMTFEWLNEDTIVVVSLKTVNRASIDLCQQVLHYLLSQWPQDKPLHALYDFPEVGLTPYLRQKMNELRDSKPPTLKCKLAVIIPNNSLGYIMYLYWHAYPQGNPDIQVQMFDNKATALEWLNPSAN